jgi:hypothetical protein
VRCCSAAVDPKGQERGWRLEVGGRSLKVKGTRLKAKG